MDCRTAFAMMVMPDALTDERNFDIFLVCLTATLLFVPMLIGAIAICLTSKGPALYCYKRFGRKNVTLKMPKFRSMWVSTPAVAT